MYLSDCHFSSEFLISNNIQLILNCAKNLKNPETKIPIFSIPLVDDETDNVLRYIESAIDRINSVPEVGVLIHCAQGVSRCVAILTGYIMKTERIPFGDAYLKIERSYPRARIADNFRDQLIRYGTEFEWDMNGDPIGHRIYRTQNRIERTIESGSSGNFRFICRNCRYCLFRDLNDISCKFAQNIFIECMQWIPEGQIEGSLLCPGCQKKVGQFSWSGIPCKCELGYHAPAFVITSSKVDKMPLSISYRGNGEPKTKY